MRLAFYISGHGLGHLAQSAPVIDAISAREPSVRWTILTAIPEQQLRTRISSPFDYVSWHGDPGFAMRDALTVDREASRRAWHATHANNRLLTQTEIERLAAIGANAILSNVSHVPIAAASELGIKRVALCSLNWADVYESFWGKDRVCRDLRDTYRKLDLFVRPAPSMDMSWLEQARLVAPVAQRGTSAVDAIDAAFGSPSSMKTGLISGGGHEFRVDPSRWPEQNWRWLIPGDSAPGNHCVGVERVDAPFIDLVASVDVVVAKPGYGLFAEATCAGKAMLYLDRSDWPEQPAILGWRRRFGQILEIDTRQLSEGRLCAPADRVLSEAAFSPPQPDGASEAAGLIVDLLNL